MDALEFSFDTHSYAILSQKGIATTDFMFSRSKSAQQFNTKSEWVEFHNPLKNMKDTSTV